MNRYRRLLFLFLLTAAAVALWTMRSHIGTAMGRWLDVGERPRRVDYVMVLNGDENSRPFVAAALIKAGFARQAIVTETAPPLDDVETLAPFDYTVNCQALQKRGVPEKDIVVLPAAATTTRDEAAALATFLQGRPNVRVSVVTSSFHTRRSRWIFARALGAQAKQVSFVSAPTDEFDLDRWWENEIGFVAVLSEYLKFGFYLVCYGHVAQFAAACALVALIAHAIQRREKMRS